MRASHLWRPRLAGSSWVIASLAAGASLMAAVALVEASTLMATPHQAGYLLYAHSGFCAPARNDVRADPSTATAHHRARRSFQPERSAKASMPPGLGLTAEWLSPAAGTAILP